MSRRRKWQALVVVLTVLAVAGVARLLRDPRAYFAERRAPLARIEEDAAVVENGYLLRSVRVTAANGLALNLLVRRAIADSAKPRLPLAVILGGHYTGREAARMLGETPGVLVAALSYPFDGNPRPDALTFLRDIPRIRRAFLDTPPAITLALDYLFTRPDVDSSRVEGIGVSLGAPFMVIAGSLDARFSRVWALHGSGGSYTPLEANMRTAIPFRPLRVVAAAVANLIIDGPRLDPVRWVDGISPRPFIMVNALNDERLPREAIEALYEAAREPKELVWMPGVHVHADRETILKLVEMVMGRIGRPASRT